MTIKLYHGDKGDFPFKLMDEATKEPIDLAGSLVELVITTELGGLIHYSYSGHGITHASETGVFNWFIPEVFLSALLGLYRFSIRRTTITGIRRTCLVGTLDVSSAGFTEA